LDKERLVEQKWEPRDYNNSLQWYSYKGSQKDIGCLRCPSIKTRKKVQALPLELLAAGLDML
jgi:hypothetical protein